MKLLLVLQVVWCLMRTAPALAGGMQLILQNANAAPRLVSLWGGAGSEQFVLKSDGTPWVWGWNSFGQQGDGTTNNTGVPHQVLGPGGVGLLTNLSAILGGETHNPALRADGTVWDWGRNFFGELMMGSPIGAPLPDTSAPASGSSEIQPDVKTFLPPKNA